MVGAPLVLLLLVEWIAFEMQVLPDGTYSFS